MVILHKEHKIYYNNSQNEFQPFILPPPLHRDTRSYVQGHFRSQYKLELSVRPIQKKWMSEDGKPYVLLNAQIQT